MELDDTIKARIIQADGHYERVDRRGKPSINSQEVFCEEAAAAEKQEKETIGRIFIPMERPEE